MEILDFDIVFDVNGERPGDVPMRQLLIRLPEPGLEIVKTLSRLSGQSPVEFVTRALWSQMAARMDAEPEEQSLIVALLQANGLTMDESGVINHAE